MEDFPIGFIYVEFPKLSGMIDVPNPVKNGWIGTWKKISELNASYNGKCLYIGTEDGTLSSEMPAHSHGSSAHNHGLTVYDHSHGQGYGFNSKSQTRNRSEFSGSSSSTSTHAVTSNSSNNSENVDTSSIVSSYKVGNDFLPPSITVTVWIRTA